MIVGPPEAAAASAAAAPRRAMSRSASISAGGSQSSMTTRSQGRSPQTDVVLHGTGRRACRTRIVRVSRCGSDSGRARRMVRSATAATAQTAAAKSAGREMLLLSALLGVASLLLWALFLCFCFFGMVVAENLRWRIDA